MARVPGPSLAKSRFPDAFAPAALAAPLVGPMFRRALSAVAAATALLAAAPAVHAAEAPITFGVASPYSKESAQESAAEIEGYLGSALKRPVG